MAARQSTNKPLLFLSEAEVARVHGQTLSDWTAKAKILERDGFPRIESVLGGRCWLAILAYWRRRYGLSTVEVSQPDGEENLNAL